LTTNARAHQSFADHPTSYTVQLTQPTLPWLTPIELIDLSQAVALSYVENYTLRRTRLYDVLERYPGSAQEHIHKAKVRITLAPQAHEGLATAELCRCWAPRLNRGCQVRITLQRALLKHMCTQYLGKKSPSSFVPRSVAKGFKCVEDSITLEQKVDAIYERYYQKEESPVGDRSVATVPGVSEPRRQSRPLAPITGVGGNAASLPTPAAAGPAAAGPAAAGAAELAAVQRDMTELKQMMQQFLQAPSATPSVLAPSTLPPLGSVPPGASAPSSASPRSASFAKLPLGPKWMGCLRCLAHEI
jgi:hypothetical protein